MAESDEEELLRFLNNGKTKTQEDWFQFFAAQSYRKNNAMLTALQNAVATHHPQCTALCSLRGSAHDHILQFTILQFDGPTFAWYEWDEETNQLTDPQSANIDLDLRKEFQLLREEPILLRGGENENIDRKSGIEGRITVMFLIVGDEAEWLEFARPLSGGVYPNTAINRIYCAMMGSQEGITLIDDPPADRRNRNVLARFIKALTSSLKLR